MHLALHASPLCSGKVTCGLKCAVAAGESRPALDLLQVEQVSRLPERVVLAAAPKQPSAIIPSRNLLQYFLLLSVFTGSFLLVFFPINIIITIMTLIKRRLIIIVISDTAGIFVVIIFILRGAGFTRRMIRFAAKNKNATLCMRGARQCRELVVAKGQRAVERT